MAITNKVSYCSSALYAVMAAWAASTAVSAGTLRRPLTTPAVGNERAYVAYQGGNTNTVEPTWPTGKGGTVTDNTVKWIEVTGQPGVNGDLTSCPTWAGVAKSHTAAVGDIVTDAAASILLVCTTGGPCGTGTEPTWNTTAGVTTTDASAVWTSLGAVGNFGIWAAPHARDENVGSSWLSFTVVVGWKLFLDSNHSQTTASTLGIGPSGSAATPGFMLSVSASAAPPTSLQAGATIAQTGAVLTINTANCHVYGVTYSQSSNNAIATSNSLGGELIFENCSFVFTGANASAKLQTSCPAKMTFRGCAVTFSNAGQSIVNGNGISDCVLEGCTINGTAVNALFSMNGANPGTTHVHGCDFSGNAATALVGIGASNQCANYDFADCKLPSGIVVQGTGSINMRGWRISLARCDSAATTYRQEHYQYEGSIVQDTANYMNGGASDGTTPISQKITTNANATFPFPLCYPAEPACIFDWIDTTGSARTVSMDVMNDGVTLTNADIWLEVESLDDSGSPLGTIHSSAQGLLANALGMAGTAHATSSATWTTSGVTSPVLQTLSVTFTNQMRGPFRGRVVVAKPSKSIWLNAKPVVT